MHYWRGVGLIKCLMRYGRGAGRIFDWVRTLAAFRASGDS